MKPPAFGGLTLADRAFEWLEAAIIKGDYPAGTKLDEVELAQAFGISRGPVREAIRRLEGRKLVERIAHVGARVAKRSQADLIDLLYIREALEGMACRLATSRISDASLDDLEELLAKHASEKPVQAGDSYFQKPGDLDFHFRIIQESGNRQLTEMLCEDLYHLLRVYRYKSSARKGRSLEALEEHRAILAAMRARDPDLAEKCMRQHLSHSRQAAHEEQENGVRPPRLKRA
ncbi:GntR family transcriptional regulator [Oleispirillum naphthae]|uniref:GntR family transcriptional regulator n=1 Tax=Oleispirillum naphthae TaxID=2838853 RepID=UPI0030825D1F